MSDFHQLTPFIERWGKATAAKRLRQRSEAELSELEHFYSAVSPFLEEIILYLNQFPIDEIPEDDRPLAYMALAVCELDDAIHRWKSNNLDYISDPVSWRTKNSFIDYC